MGLFNRWWRPQPPQMQIGPRTMLLMNEDTRKWMEQEKRARPSWWQRLKRFFRAKR